MTAVDPALLCCPLCHGRLRHEGSSIVCEECGAGWPQRDGRYVNLLPDDGRQRNDWSRRQAIMIAEYDALIVDREHAILAYSNDYPPLAENLGRCFGRVLDVGGGNGISRHWLPEDAELVVLDPDTSWLDQPWQEIAHVFPCLARPTPFVQGVGERMPFRDASFDHVLSIWSLNHAFRPGDVIGEVARVLRPGGSLVLVLDDVPPTWHDLLSGSFPTHTGVERLGWMLRRLLATITGWPVHRDHLPVRETDVRRWCEDRLVREARRWSGPYLVLELSKRGQGDSPSVDMAATCKRPADV